MHIHPIVVWLDRLVLTSQCCCAVQVTVGQRWLQHSEVQRQVLGLSLVSQLALDTVLVSGESKGRLMGRA